MGPRPRPTEPARISAFSRERDRSGQRTASTRSSLADPSSPATVTVSLAAPTLPEPTLPEPCDDETCFKAEPCFKEETCMTETALPEPTPEQAALFLRVRRMML